MDPSDAENFIRRGLLHIILGNTKKACSDWRKAEALGHPKSFDLIREKCN